jgi:hypothetical protein
MNQASPAKLYCGVVGAVLTIAGIIGFFYNAHFGSGSDVFGNDTTVKVFGILTVNGWHNVVHLATGVLGLLAVGYFARQYATLLGVVYIGVAVWGFIIGSGDSIASIVPINTADNILHLALGVLGVLAGLAPEEPAPAAATP